MALVSGLRISLHAGTGHSSGTSALRLISSYTIPDSERTSCCHFDWSSPHDFGFRRRRVRPERVPSLTFRPAGSPKATSNGQKPEEDGRTIDAEKAVGASQDGENNRQPGRTGEEAKSRRVPATSFLDEAKGSAIIAACGIGLLTGVGVVLFNNVVHEIRDFFWDGIPLRGASWLREEPLGEIWQRVILVPVCGGVLVGAINGIRDILEERVPEKQMLAGISTSDVKGTIRSVFKAIAASVTLGTGNSLGPEGPSVEIGASIGKGVGKLFGNKGSNNNKDLSLIAAGSAAGISSGFNASVAGCFFAVESVLWPSPSDATPSLINSTSVVILSAVLAAVISEIGLGPVPAFTVPEYDFRSPGELPLYLLLGAICGLVSLVLSKCTSYALEVADYAHKSSGIPKFVFPAFGGLAVGVIALGYPEVLYWGFENVDILLESRPFVKGLPADVLFQLVGMKILATSLSRASGLVGGYYAPSLFIGAATGMAYGKFLAFIFSGLNPTFHQSILEVASPQAYGLVGMAATLAGVCQVPLTSVLLLFELVQDYHIVLPLLGAVGLSSWVTSSLTRGSNTDKNVSSTVNPGTQDSSLAAADAVDGRDTIYSPSMPSEDTDNCQLENSLCLYTSDEEKKVEEKLTVSQAMRTRYPTIKLNSSLSEAVDVMLSAKLSSVIVVNNDDFPVGTLALKDIQEFCGKANALTSEYQEISNVFRHQIDRYQDWTVTPNSSLSSARKIMDSVGVDKVPVISCQTKGRGYLIGIVDREGIDVACKAAITTELLQLYTGDR